MEIQDRIPPRNDLNDGNGEYLMDDENDALSKYKCWICEDSKKLWSVEEKRYVKCHECL